MRRTKKTIELEIIAMINNILAIHDHLSQRWTVPNHEAAQFEPRIDALLKRCISVGLVEIDPETDMVYYIH